MRRTIQTFKRLMVRLKYILEKKHKRKMPRLFICIFFTSLFELLGVTSILPFVYAMLDIDSLMNNKYSKPIFDRFGLTDGMSVLFFLGICVVILYIVKNIFLVFSVTYQTNFSSRIQKELQVKMLHSYLIRPYQFFLDSTAAEISRGCGQDIGAVFSTITTLFGLAMSIFTTILIGTYMIVSDPIIAIGTLIVAIACVLVLTKIFKPTMIRIGNKVRKASEKQGNAFNQTVYGIKELMVMGRQDLFVHTYDEAAEELRRINVRNTFVNALPSRTIEAFFITGFMSVVLFRLKTGGEPASYVPTLATFALGAFKVLPYISGITNKMNSLAFNEPFLESAYQNLKAAEAYKLEMEEYNRTHDGVAERNVDDPSIHFENAVEVKNVFWKYTKGKEAVLTDTNITLKKGESIGLVGPSGAGKTTMADIFLGLLQPQQGGIYMDGKDIFTMPKTWARIVGYVPQAIFLMAGSIRDNVAFGMTDFTDDDIWHALDQAQLGDFVRNLPDGLNTETGERGIKLSGGQRQRVAIARALANRPEILVLDEATSALDNETETAIMESIDALQGQITMIIVAHRLTTIKNCDRIYRIDNGVATEVSHKEVFGD